MASYLTYPLDKEERIKERKILTSNRLKTINSHETSYEGMSAHYEAGEDAVEAIIQSKVAPFMNITPKKRPITQWDIDNVPTLRETREAAQYWYQRAKSSTGRAAYIALKSYKEFSQFQYFLRDSYLGYNSSKSSSSSYTQQETQYPSKEWVEDGVVHYEGFSLCNSKLCGVLLKNYLKLKGQSWGLFNDLWFMIQDFEKLLFEALEDLPIYQTIVECKWSELSNADIVKEIEAEYGKTYTPEYISLLYSRRIPETIAKKAYFNVLDYWYLEVEKGTYKTCTNCGRTLLALPQFFHKNATSKDGYYSICKQCRSNKRKGKLKHGDK